MLFSSFYSYIIVPIIGKMSSRESLIFFQSKLPLAKTFDRSNFFIEAAIKITDGLLAFVMNSANCTVKRHIVKDNKKISQKC